MESSSSPSSNKDYDKTTPATATAAEAGRDDSDFYPLSSPLHLLQEAVRFVLRCLGFERENLTPRSVESSSHGSGEKGTEMKGKSPSLPSPQPPEGGGGGGQGDGGAATASLDPPTTSAADDPPPTEADGGDPTAAADDPPSTAAQGNTLATAAFRTPTRPPINPGQGGQHN